MNKSAVAAFVGTFFVSLGVMPVAVALGKRLGMVVQPRLFGRSVKSISYLGGAGIAVALVAALVAGTAVYEVQTATWAALLGAFMLLVFGIADDRIGEAMTPAGRLAVQALVAYMVWAAGLRPTPTDIGWVDALLTVFFLTAATNAFNLLDNMDGIASSTAAATFAGIATIGALSGQQEISLLAAALSGAALGFIPHNVFRGHVYLGNSGALFLGFLAGSLTLMLDFPLRQPLGFASAIAILAVPATDTTLVLVSRVRAGRAVLQGGIDHLSHRLVYLGASTKGAALIHVFGSLTGAGSVVLAIELGTLWAIPVVIALFGVAFLAMLRMDVYQEAVEQEVGRMLMERREAIASRRQ